MKSVPEVLETGKRDLIESHNFGEKSPTMNQLVRG